MCVPAEEETMGWTWGTLRGCCSFWQRYSSRCWKLVGALVFVSVHACTAFITYGVFFIVCVSVNMCVCILCSISSCIFMIVYACVLVHIKSISLNTKALLSVLPSSFPPWGHANGAHWRQRGEGEKGKRKGERKKSGALDWIRQGEGDSNLTATINCTDKYMEWLVV